MLFIIFVIKNKYTIIKNIELSPKLSKNDIVNLKEGQRKMTNMLREFDRICRKYNLKYWCIGGTLIGVLRHKGWIPWDGDIDIAMLEKDYDKFKKIVQTELPKEMWFQSSDNDKNYKSKLMKIRDLNSCYIEYTNNGGKQWHNGLQLDIFLYNKKGKNLICTNPTSKETTINFIYDTVFPLKEKTFEDIIVYIPNKYVEYTKKAWGEYPPKLLEISKRYPHEGKMDGFKTCNFHYDKYPKLHTKQK